DPSAPDRNAVPVRLSAELAGMAMAHLMPRAIPPGAPPLRAAIAACRASPLALRPDHLFPVQPVAHRMLQAAAAGAPPLRAAMAACRAALLASRPDHLFPVLAVAPAQRSSDCPSFPG